ncbi:hypothetical protein [Neomoorella mulderi]|uniref:hypothetical protein n=1 Tax=Neomoorella mulderi TaxID=202604 RepID=UPI00191C6899|nr:hypothetical protein [Moorella mulderi]
MPGFIAEFNARFAVDPADPEPAFRPAPSLKDLECIICFKQERKATNGSTISFASHTYKLIDQKGNVALLLPKSNVTVLTHLDGSLSALYQDKPFSLKEFHSKPSSGEEKAGQVPSQSQSKPARRSPVPGQNHPWRSSLKEKPRPPKPDPVESYFAMKDKNSQIRLQKLYAET